MKRVAAVISLVALAIFGSGGLVLATPVPAGLGALAFHAMLVDQSPAATLLPGTTASYTVRFRNVGVTPWQRGGRTQVNLGVRGDLTSFADQGMDAGWLSANRLATTNESLVLPGMVGTFNVRLRAPVQIGVYRVPVRLVADGTTWLEDAGTTLMLTSDLGFHSALVDQTNHPMLHPGETSGPLLVRIRNTGARTWTKGVVGQQVNLGVVGDDKTLGSLGVAWPSADRVAVQAEPTVIPGGMATFTFRVRAPLVPGTYPIRLRPVVDGLMWLEDDELVSLLTVVPVGVSPGAPQTPAAQEKSQRSTVSLPSFTFRATTNPTAVMPGASIKIDAVITSTVTTSNIVLGFEIHGPSDAIVFQKWSRSETFLPGQEVLQSVPWTVPAGDPLGTYTVTLSAYSPGWKILYGANVRATSFDVSASPSASPSAIPVPTATVAPAPTATPAATATPAPTVAPTATTAPTVAPVPTPTATPMATAVPTATIAPTVVPVPTATATPTATQAPAPTPSFTTSSVVTPSSVTLGGTLSATNTVTGVTASTALVDIEIWAAGGTTAAYQVWFDNQTFAAGQQQTYTATWQVPTTAALGTYTVKLGVYGPAWAVRYTWVDPATTFSVTAPTPTPTPTLPPTPAPTVAPTPTTAPVPATSLNDTVFIYNGTWAISNAAPKYLGDDHYSSTPGSSYTVSFIGTQVLLYAAVAPYHGIGSISLDGGASRDVDFYSATRTDQKLMYTSPVLPSGTHSLTVTVTGRKNAASTEAIINADRADVVGGGLGPTPTPAPVPTPAPTPVPGSAVSALHVQGNKILNAQGQNVILHGVNRSGFEQGCSSYNTMFGEGPLDQAAVDAIKSWRSNVVRVTLNEDCWLGINGVPAAFAGTNYQTAVKNWVNLLTQNGLYAIVDLHWSAPGTTLATGQQPMPDMDHSPTYWTQVATTFKNNPGVIFDPYNEPYPDSNRDTTAAWTCWRDGGTCPGVPFQAAGMQTLVNAIRNTGATNLILLGGVQYSNTFTQWIQYKPTDPQNNLAASWHVYEFTWCVTVSCYDSNVGTLAASFPLVAEEVGVDNCDATWFTTLLNWLDAKGIGYLAWTWNIWGGCNAIALISDYTGTPTQYGLIYKNHLAGLP